MYRAVIKRANTCLAPWSAITPKSKSYVACQYVTASPWHCVYCVHCHWVYLTLAQNLKLQLATSKMINVKVTREIIGKHVSKEFEIFEATSGMTKNIKLLLNSLHIIIPQTSIELERVEHDWTIAVLIIFVSLNHTGEMLDFNNCSISI